jgi:hypothetical protein
MCIYSSPISQWLIKNFENKKSSKTLNENEHEVEARMKLYATLHAHGV